jgi:hypothetical protein
VSWSAWCGLEGLPVVARRNASCLLLVVQAGATVKTHVSRAMTKLHARDRAQLVVLAYESGLVTPATRPVHED